jgi:hypothetical protein
MSVNRVLLIGLVGECRRGATGTAEVVVVTGVSDGFEWERHRVRLDGQLDDRTRELEVGQSVFVQGRLAWPVRGQAVVVAADIWPGVEPPAPVISSQPPAGTHASPRPHDRIGHVRRVGRGDDERLVWVRATRVGAAGWEE